MGTGKCVEEGEMVKQWRLGFYTGFSVAIILALWLVVIAAVALQQ